MGRKTSGKSPPRTRSCWRCSAEPAKGLRPSKSHRAPWLVDSIFWRASRASDRYADHTKHETVAMSRIAVQFTREHAAHHRVRDVKHRTQASSRLLQYVS